MRTFPPRRSILVCDADAMFREVFASYARSSGCDVHEAADGQAALDALAAGAPEAIVLELVMPGIVDGYQVLKHLRHERRHGGMRVVATATGGAAPAGECAVEVLYKPIPPGALLQRLAREDAPEPAAPLCVFVVEDHADSRELLVEALACCGIHAFGFATGAAALSGLRAIRPSAIVTDYTLPDLDGAELARRAHAVVPGVPVIAVTGHAHVAARRGGDFDHAFLKPYDVGEVAQVVRDLAERASDI